MAYITIYFNGNAMSIKKDFADLKGIKDGYRILQESEFWEILKGHAEHQIPKLKMLIEAKNSVN